MKRVDHLFQGRFKALLVDTDSYLTTFVRYIHLNPVRANLIPDISVAWWSSHRDYLFQRTAQTITEKIKWIIAEKPAILYDFLKYQACALAII